MRVLEAAWARLREAPALQSTDAPALLAQLQQAAARYRGDFLDGFSLSDAPAFDEWATIQREQWHRPLDDRGGDPRRRRRPPGLAAPATVH